MPEASPQTPTLADLQAFAEQATGRALAPGEAMPGGGSARAYFRFSPREPGAEGGAEQAAEGAGGSRAVESWAVEDRVVEDGAAEDAAESWVGVISGNQGETRAFLGFTRHFGAQGLPVPRIIAAEEARGLYLMEDLGTETLASQLAAWRAVPIGRVMAMAALNRVVGWLPRFQVHGASGLDWRLCHESAELDGPVFEADLERFLWLYIPRHAPSAKPGDDVLAELDELVLRLETVPREHFCYRDFQTRNIMWRDGPVFLDYQSGRRGALHYDLASFLYSPDTGLTEPERGQLIDVYLQGLKDCGVTLNRLAFLADFHPFVLVRRLQALGAYAHLGGQGKTEYLRKIPPALADLKQLLAAGKLSLGLPKLEAWLRKVVDTPPSAGRGGKRA